MTTARQLAEKGFKIFRAGVWKPRTKPGGFEGMGEAALPWLQRVKEETGMPSRCIPFEQEHIADTCPVCGKKADKMVVWGIAY